MSAPPPPGFSSRRGRGWSTTAGVGEQVRPRGMPGDRRGEAAGEPGPPGGRAAGRARRTGGMRLGLGCGGRCRGRGGGVRRGAWRAAGAGGGEDPRELGRKGRPCLGRPGGCGRVRGGRRPRRSPLGLCRPLSGLAGSGGSSGKFWDLYAGERLVAGQVGHLALSPPTPRRGAASEAGGGRGRRWMWAGVGVWVLSGFLL